MKIVFVTQPTDAFPSAQGASISIWVDALASRLTGEHFVHIVCAQSDSAEIESSKPYRIHRVSTWIDEKLEQLVGRIERRLKRFNVDDREFYYRYYYFSSLYYIFYAISAARAVRRIDPDWVILSNFSQHVPVIRFHNRKTKIFLMMHCDWLVECRYKAIHGRLAKLDGIGGCSHYIVNGITDRFPEYAEKCHTVHNASDLKNVDKLIADASVPFEVEGNNWHRNRKIVLFVGRIAPEKGLHILLRAISLVREQIPNVILLVAGSLSRQPPSPVGL